MLEKNTKGVCALLFACESSHIMHQKKCLTFPYARPACTKLRLICMISQETACYDVVLILPVSTCTIIM